MQIKKNYYRILGIDKDATEDRIKSAYRRLALLYHPDRNSGDKEAEERFKEVNEAYTVLGDRKRRQKYDKLAHTPFRHRYKTGNIFEDINFEDIFRDFELRFNEGISRGSFCGRGRGYGRRRRRCSHY